jgi:hypothetical protein
MSGRAFGRRPQKPSATGRVADPCEGGDAVFAATGWSRNSGDGGPNRLPADISPRVQEHPDMSDAALLRSIRRWLKILAVLLAVQLSFLAGVLGDGLPAGALLAVGLAVGFVVLVDLFVSVSRAQATADDR